MILPPLKNGDTVGVMAPSSHVEKADIERSAKRLEERGYRVFIHPQTFARHNQSAGAHEEKLEALHALWADDTIRAIWAAGGGNRALHILDSLDFDLVHENPKPLIGFSDVTALLNGIYAHTGQPAIHGPVFKRLHSHRHFEDTLALLEGHKPRYELKGAQTLNPGRAEGVLVGGNLSLFQYLPQTLPGDICAGAILFLEDCNEELSRIDRMLLHLRRSGILGRVSGLITGEFTDLQDSARPFGFTLEEIIREHTDGLNIPILTGAPFGHGENLLPLPIGMRAALDTDKKSLEIL
ncbi:MAG: LD-carboxypeptidase [Alphaproteobacteria bacterium]|nr:LD-carboxypeptidase [Alphaproteobacteria bacterium]